MRISDWSSDVFSSDLLILLAGWLRRVVPRWLRDSGRSASANDALLSGAQYAQAATNSKTSKNHTLLVSALMELDTGLPVALADSDLATRSEEHTSELQSLMRISYAVVCLKKKNK